MLTIFDSFSPTSHRFFSNGNNLKTKNCLFGRWQSVSENDGVWGRDEESKNTGEKSERMSEMMGGQTSALAAGVYEYVFCMWYASRNLARRRFRLYRSVDGAHSRCRFRTYHQSNEHTHWFIHLIFIKIIFEIFSAACACVRTTYVYVWFLRGIIRICIRV